MVSLQISEDLSIQWVSQHLKRSLLTLIKWVEYFRRRWFGVCQQLCWWELCSDSSDEITQPLQLEASVDELFACNGCIETFAVITHSEVLGVESLRRGDLAEECRLQLLHKWVSKSMLQCIMLLFLDYQNVSEFIVFEGNGFVLHSQLANEVNGFFP